MNIQSVEYTIYCNLFEYINIIGFEPIHDSGEEADAPLKKEKKDLIKTLQFYSYAKIKAASKENKDEIMYIFLIGDSSIVSKSLEFKKLLNTIQEKETHVVIVSKEGVKTPVKKFLAKYTKKKLWIKNLLYSHFKVDVRKNEMVPKHTLCDMDETQRVMTDNHIDGLLQFPKIKSTDPQVLWLGGKAGQLVKIIRRDVTGEVLYYRVII